MSDPAPITYLTSREANQDFSRAKRAAKRGPVVITERGRPALALMDYDSFLRLQGAEPNLLEALAMSDGADIDLPLPQRRIGSHLDFDVE